MIWQRSKESNFVLPVQSRTGCRFTRPLCCGAVHRIRTCKPFPVKCLQNIVLTTRTHGVFGAYRRSRTVHLLLTEQTFCLLNYASILATNRGVDPHTGFPCHQFSKLRSEPSEFVCHWRARLDLNQHTAINDYFRLSKPVPYHLGLQTRIWSRTRDSNPHHTVYGTVARPVVLIRQSWLPLKESNFRHRCQRPLCYRYTKGQYWYSRQGSNLQLTRS